MEWFLKRPILHVHISLDRYVYVKQRLNPVCAECVLV